MPEGINLHAKGSSQFRQLFNEFRDATDGNHHIFGDVNGGALFDADRDCLRTSHI